MRIPLLRPVCTALILLACLCAVLPATGVSAQEVQSGAAADPAAPRERMRLNERFNQAIDYVNARIAAALFFDAAFGAFKKPMIEDGQVLRDEQGRVRTTGPELPFLVIFLAGGAVLFTFCHSFINVRGFRHAIAIVRGKYTVEGERGEITPFRALTSALSATVGLGNIAGVAIAVNVGGPGAIFWMMVLGVFGMTAKFHESTLAQMYRVRNEDGSYSGGPMYYLDRGLKEINPMLGKLGRALAILFAVFCMGGALGGGNMFQANQSFEGFYTAFVAVPSLAERTRTQMSADELRPLLTEKQLRELMTPAQREARAMLEQVRAELPDEVVTRAVLPAQIETILPADQVQADLKAREQLRQRVSIGFGLLMSALVAVVVIGGITRIGAATSRIVPTMCVLYVLGCLVVILFNLREVPNHIALIFREAFGVEAGLGGLIGVLVIGFTRAAFSSEAGLGSSAIAHSAAKTDEPVREGLVASLEPFIDTIVVCFMTAMVVLITDAYRAPEFIAERSGTAITLYAFQQTRLGAWFPYVLSISIVLFAFSTMIAWCYYGERAYGYLFGLRSVIVFRLLFVACVFIGAVASLGQVIDFADLMILSMALPNIFGGIILIRQVMRRRREYWGRYRSGTMRPGERSPGYDI